MSGVKPIQQLLLGERQRAQSNMVGLVRRVQVKHELPTRSTSSKSTLGPSSTLKEIDTVQDPKIPPAKHVKDHLSPTTASPFPKAGFISRWFFLWTNKIFKVASQKTLRNSDLYTIGKLIQSRSEE